ncbi:MAG: ABC transporter substrate-binding protein [Bacillota bacterium]|nr:ABC transporter substrate-binding protein [Bacillota bacterium]
MKKVFWVAISIIFFALAGICVSKLYLNSRAVTEASIKVSDFSGDNIQLFKNNTFIEKEMNALLYKTLVVENKSDESIKKGIIKQLDVSTDRLSYKFELNNDFKWSNGRTINSDDVIETLKSKKQNNLKSLDNIMKVIKVDDNKFTITLKSEDENFLNVLSQQHIYPVELKNDKIDSNNYKDIVTLKNTSIKNLNSVEIAIAHDKDLIHFKNSGECDYSLYKASDFIDNYNNIKQLRIKPVYLENMYDLCFNLKSDFSSNENNRQAFMDNINSSEIINNVYKDTVIADKTNSIFFYYYNSYQYYDLKYSNNKLKLSNDKTISILVNKDDKTAVNIASEIISQLKGKANILPTYLSIEDYNNELSKQLDKKYDLLIFNTKTNRSILDFVRENYSSNITGINNLNDMLAGKFYPAERTEMSKYLVDNNIVRPLVYEQKIVKFSKKVYLNKKYDEFENLVNQYIDLYE